MPAPTRLTSARLLAERSALRAVMALPEPVQRRLAGRPVRIDGQELATDLQLMLRLQRVARQPGVDALPLEEGRALLRETTAHAGGDQPIGFVRSLEVAGLPARLYVPRGAPTTGPLLVFLHGGGFFCGDLDSHDAGCRFLAENAATRVLSVAYRLAPEHPFPAAHDDAEAAYAWVVEHAAEVGADPSRLGVGGDSAGGNLAAHVAITAARRGWPCAVQLLIYPTAQHGHATRSADLFGSGLYLTSDFMAAADRHYASGAPAGDPRLSPVLAELPAGLAAALVYTAGFDPLRDEGEAYAEHLRAAGVAVQQTRFADQIHGYLNVCGVGRSAPAANLQMARALAAAWR